MAAIALAVAARVNVVESIAQVTSYAGAALVAGSGVRYDANGRFIAALADTAPNANLVGVIDKSVAIYQPVTAIRIGVMDGWDFTALAYGAPVYLATAGGLDTAAGTVSTIVGEVYAAHAQSFGAAPDKLLWICIP